MKTKQIILMVLITVVLMCGNVYASTIILPYDKTTYMDINTDDSSDWEIISPDNAGSVAITKSGKLIMSPNVGTRSLVIKNSVLEKEYNFLGPTFFDFESDNFYNSEIYFDQAEIKADADNKYVAAKESNKAILSFSNVEIMSDVLTIELDIYKEDVSTSNLLSVQSKDGTIFGQILLNRRSASSVYFSYKNESGTTLLRNNIIDIEKWVHIVAEFNFDDKTISLYADGEKMIDNIPFVGISGDVSVGSLAFSVNVDNAQIYTGRKYDNADLRLNIPNEITASVSGRNAVKCDAEINIEGIWCGIDGKYLNISINGSDCVTAKDDYIIVNGETLTSDQNISIDAGIVISENIYSTQSDVTIKKGEEISGEEYSKFIVDKAMVDQTDNNTIVKVSAYNPEDEDKSCYVIIGSFDNNKCSSISFHCWEIPKYSYNISKEIAFANMQGSDIRVYVLDAITLADIQ